MALSKLITLPSGHQCDYWKIIKLEKDFNNGQTTIEIIGYLNDTTREEGYAPLQDSLKKFITFDIGHGGTDEAYVWLSTYKEPASQIPQINPEFDPELSVSDTNYPYFISTEVVYNYGEFYGAEQV